MPPVTLPPATPAPLTSSPVTPAPPTVAPAEPPQPTLSPQKPPLLTLVPRTGVPPSPQIRPALPTALPTAVKPQATRAPQRTPTPRPVTCVAHDFVSGGAVRVGSNVGCAMAGGEVADGGVCYVTRNGVCVGGRCSGGVWATFDCALGTPGPAPLVAGDVDVRCGDGSELPCTARVWEDNSVAVPVNPEGPAALNVGRLFVPLGMPTGISTECRCTAGCVGAEVTATGELTVLAPPNFAGVSDVACGFRAASARGVSVVTAGEVFAARITHLPVNDPPGYTVETLGHVVLPWEVADSDRSFHVPYLAAVTPGPPGAVDEALQELVVRCASEGSGVLTKPPTLRLGQGDLTGRSGPGGMRGILSFTVRRGAAAGKELIYCDIIEATAGGLSTRTPPFHVSIGARRLVPPDDAALFDFASAVIAGGGSALVFTFEGGAFQPPVGELFGMAVEGPGGQRTAPPPLLTLTTNRGEDTAPKGLVATHLKSPATFATARVLPGGDRIELLFEDPDYWIPSLLNEVVTLTFAPDILAGNLEFNRAFCAGTGAAGLSNCAFELTLHGETPDMPQTDEIHTTLDAVAGAVNAAGIVAPVGSSATKTGILALATQAMLCPQTVPDGLDRTLNPLGLTVGGGLYQEYQGAVIGMLVISTALIAVCSLLAFFVSFKIGHVKFGDLHRSGISKKIDRWYILTRARFGWLVIPFCFLYGSACVSSAAVLVYSRGEFKAFAVVCTCAVVLGVPAWVVLTSRHVHTYSEYKPLPPSGWVVWCFWGTREWVPRERPGALSWYQLNRLTFDSYRPQWRCFLVGELLVIFALSALTAWHPHDMATCYIRAGSMTAVVGLFALFLAAVRPYLAPFENFMEVLIAVLETAMLTFTLIALDESGTLHDPSEHWGALWAGRMATATLWAISAKFVMVVGVFVVDEYGLWRISITARGDSTDKLKFVRFLMCCGGIYDRREVYSEHKPDDGSPSDDDAYMMEEIIPNGGVVRTRSTTLCQNASNLAGERKGSDFGESPTTASLLVTRVTSPQGPGSMPGSPLLAVPLAGGAAPLPSLGQPALSDPAMHNVMSPPSLKRHTSGIRGVRHATSVSIARGEDLQASLVLPSPSAQQTQDGSHDAPVDHSSPLFRRVSSTLPSRRRALTVHPANMATLTRGRPARSSAYSRSPASSTSPSPSRKQEQGGPSTAAASASPRDSTDSAERDHSPSPSPIALMRSITPTRTPLTGIVI